MSASTNYNVSDPIAAKESHSTGVKQKRDTSPTQKKNVSYNDKSSITSFSSSTSLENCRNWVNLSQDEPQKSLNKSPEKAPFKKVLSSNSADEQQCDSPCKEDSDDTITPSTSSTRCKGKRFWVKEQKFNLLCEWKNCNHIMNDVYLYVRHVSNHIPDLDIKVNEENKEVYACLWASCGFGTEDQKEIVRHVNFHSYHTKLKYIGILLMKKLHLLTCTFDPEGCNMIPELLEEFVCCWSDCDRTFNNTQMFLYHVQSHVQGNPHGRVIKGGIPCRWRGCKGIYPQVYRLSDHVRTHTQEKVIGCPTCGALFCSRSKFLDHCNRQVSEESQGYQCSHCSKYYSTERLLRDHMRHHVNHYKCSFCDMTCPSPSALGLHIRFRHLDIRPFKCQYCDYRAKTQQGLRGHINTHYADNLYHCTAEDCNFSCRTSKAIKKHFGKVHEGIIYAYYCCHICDKRFKRGAYLTSHLFHRHHFRWPSGHCRFRYKLEDEGVFRLQTVRYESLEVTQEMLRERSPDEPDTQLSSKTYNLRRLPSRTQYPSAEFEVSEDREDSPERSEPAKKILITIEELDDKGNVIKSQVMETEEVPVLSLDGTFVEDLD